jgi:LuxR family maltose regulon positive regulatory protein
MANTNTPIVNNGCLYTSDGQRIRLETGAWFTWLEAASLFSYPTRRPGYRLTVRKEKRRNGFYWFAYLKNQGKLHNKYIGRSAALTVARLDEVAAWLAKKA